MRCFVFSDFRFRYRLRLPVKEEMSRTVSCTSIDACGDDGKRDYRRRRYREMQEPNTCALLLEAQYFLSF